MRYLPALLVMAAAPLLCAAIWMDVQPSYKPYEAPVLVPPPDAVPVSGRAVVPREGELKNPEKPTPASLAQGKALYGINCAMCHGAASAARGPVGMKLVPPAPGLDPGRIGAVDDSHIFRAMTFGFGRMPQFQDKLSIRERWYIVNYLRTRR